MLPSLRERLEDFQELAVHFARQVAAQNGWKEKIFAQDAVAELRKYGWQGNVRNCATWWSASSCSPQMKNVTAPMFA